MFSVANTKSHLIPVQPIMHSEMNAISYIFPYPHATRHDALMALENARRQLPPLPSGMQDYSSIDPVYDGVGNVIGFRPFMLRKPDLHLATL